MKPYWRILKDSRASTQQIARDVADDLSVHVRTIYRWEREPKPTTTPNSASPPSPEMCEKIAAYYGIDPIELLRACRHIPAPIEHALNDRSLSSAA